MTQISMEAEELARKGVKISTESEGLGNVHLKIRKLARGPLAQLATCQALSPPPKGSLQHSVGVV